MAQAAYKKVVAVAADNATAPATKNAWTPVPTASPSFDDGGDILDTTVCGLTDAKAFRSRINGLSDVSSSMEVQWDTTRAALKIIHTAKSTRKPIWLMYLPDGADGTSGFQGKFVVESYNHSGDVGSLETVSVSLQGAGAVTASTVAML